MIWDVDRQACGGAAGWGPVEGTGALQLAGARIVWLDGLRILLLDWAREFWRGLWASAAVGTAARIAERELVGGERKEVGLFSLSKAERDHLYTALSFFSLSLSSPPLPPSFSRLLIPTRVYRSLLSFSTAPFLSLSSPHPPLSFHFSFFSLTPPIHLRPYTFSSSVN